MTQFINRKEVINNILKPEGDIGLAIQTLGVLSAMQEMVLLEFVDVTKQDLKQRTNNAIKASKSVQDWFINHPQADSFYRQVFKKEFNKNQLVLLIDLIRTVWSVGEDDLEFICESLKKNIDEPNSSNQDSKQNS